MGRHTVFKVLPSMSLKMRPKVESRGHLGFRSPLVRMKDTSEENRPCAPGETRIYHPGLLPSFSFSFSSFLLFLVEDLDCVVACPELEATGAEEEEEEEELGEMGWRLGRVKGGGSFCIWEISEHWIPMGSPRTLPRWHQVLSVLPSAFPPQEKAAHSQMLGPEARRPSCPLTGTLLSASPSPGPSEDAQSPIASHYPLPAQPSPAASHGDNCPCLRSPFDSCGWEAWLCLPTPTACDPQGSQSHRPVTQNPTMPPLSLEPPAGFSSRAKGRASGDL